MRALFGKYKYDFVAKNEVATITKATGIEVLKPIAICIAIFIGWRIGTTRVEEDFTTDYFSYPTEGFWYYMGFVFDFISFLPIIVIGVILLATAFHIWRELRWNVVLSKFYIKFITDDASGKWKLEEIVKLQCMQEPVSSVDGAAAHSLYITNRNGKRVKILTFNDSDEPESDALADLTKVCEEIKELVGLKDKPEVE